MKFGRKGASWGAGILIITFISMMIIMIVAASFQGGGFGAVTDPSYMFNYYKNLFTAEKLKEPFTLVFTLFIPFISTFAITWAFIGVLPIFNDSRYGRNTDRAGAILAFGVALYSMPMMNLFMLSFFPWSIAIASIMLFVGLIGRSIHWGVVPHIQAAADIAGAARDAQSAWGTGRPPRNEQERRDRQELTATREVEERETREFADRWNQALTGYIDALSDSRIRPPNIADLTHFSTSQEWSHLCTNLENLDRERRKAIQTGNQMLQGLQNPQEFRYLFRDKYTAAGLLNELQTALDNVKNLHDAAKRNLENVAGNLVPRIQQSQQVNESHDLAVGYNSVEEYLNRYNEFFNFRNSETGDIRTLRTRTCDLLHISA